MDRLSSSYTVILLYLVTMGTGSVDVVSAVPTPLDVLTSLRSGVKFYGGDQQHLSLGSILKYCPKDPDACRNVVSIMTTFILLIYRRFFLSRSHDYSRVEAASYMKTYTQLVIYKN
jgi:hypothetical protein